MNYAVVKNLANLLTAPLPRFIKICRQNKSIKRIGETRVTSKQIPRLS